MSTEGTTEQTITDLPMQPTGSGLADMQMQQLQAAVAEASSNDGIADEHAGFELATQASVNEDSLTKTQA